MNRTIQRGREVMLIVLFVAGFSLGALAQWQNGDQALSLRANVSSEYDNLIN